MIFWGRTFVGSTHDYKMFKKEFSPSKPWFKNVEAYVDLGYQGIKKDYSSAQHIHLPNKKPRKSKKNQKKPKSLFNPKAKSGNKLLQNELLLSMQ